MRIAHIGTSMSLNQVVLGQMVRLLERGHEVVALCPDDEWAAAIKSAGVRVIPTPFRRHDPLATIRAGIEVWLINRKERFDVIHTHNTLPGIVGRIIARLSGTRAVVHTCHAWPLHEPHGWAHGWALRALERLAAKAAHAILFQNEDDMKSLLSSKIVSGSKATLIGNGINVGAIRRRVARDARGKIRRELGISDDAFVIVVVARLEPPKGHFLLLEVLKEYLANEKTRELVALLVGDGMERDSLESKAAEYDLGNVARFTGFREDVADLLAASDVSVLTSRFEGVPRALMESMASGLPVVATDVPGTRSLVRHGETGLLVSYGDVSGMVAALRQVVDDPDLARRMGRAGQRLVESRFDEERYVDRITEVYDHLVHGYSGKLPCWNLGVGD